VSVIFGKWMNTVPTVMALGAAGGLLTVIGGFWYWATPKFFEVGYMPRQPGSGFSHQIHAGKLGMDCRYCHTKIEKSPEANIPNVATCYGCHAENHVSTEFANVDRTKFIRDAYDANESIPWRRVHKLPAYVRNFPHNIHLNAGVSCYSCHGQIDGMPIVNQRQPLSMGWCLDCHRKTKKAPEQVLVPHERITDLIWVNDHMQNIKNGKPDQPAGFDAAAVYRSLQMNPPETCGSCHY